MIRGQEAGNAHLDAVMYRMVGCLLLLGAGVLLVLTLGLLSLPRIEAAGGPMLVLPGTAGRHGIAGGALPVLGAGVLLLGLPGLLALALGRGRARFRMPPPAPPRPGFLRRPLMILVAGVALLVVVLLRG